MSLRKKILEAAQEKLFPGDYKKKIEEGKRWLAEGEYDVAEECFEMAMKLDPKPALAHFYHAQVHIMREQHPIAQTDYVKGLEFVRIHYKCLVGLYDLMIEREMYAEAYSIVKKIARFFPSNPRRLAEVLKLAVRTENFNDIEGFYLHYTEMENRSEELGKHMCAALVVCGRYYLVRKKNKPRAMELFEKAAIAGKWQPRVLREIVVTLAENGIADKAGVYFNRFPFESVKSVDYAVAEFVMAKGDLSINQLVERARNVIKAGKADPVIYRIVIGELRKLKMMVDADTFYQEAIRKYPSLQREFDKIGKAAPDPV